MKGSWSFIGFVAMSLTGLAQEAPSRSGPTSEEIAAKANAGRDVTAKFKPVAAKPAEPELSLMERCTVLSFGGISTLVPKGAVLRTPPSLASRLKLEPGSKMVHWNEFLNANRGWVRAHEVTHAQAEGKEPFSEEVAKNIGTSSSVTVATLRGFPTSVLPPKPAPANPTPPIKK